MTHPPVDPYADLHHVTGRQPKDPDHWGKPGGAADRSSDDEDPPSAEDPTEAS